MSVETNAKFITEFNEAYPRRGDLIKEGDDHMRLIKSVLKNTLPNFNRTVNISSEKLNQIDSMIETSDNTVTITGNITIKEKKTINMGNNLVNNISDPVEDGDAVNKRYLKKEGMEYAWPVGSVYITMDSRDPKDIFGFGEWEKFASGRVLIGVGSDKDSNNEAKLIALGAKGGSYNETLTDKQIPSHTHGGSGFTLSIDKGGAHRHSLKTFRDRMSIHDINGQWFRPGQTNYTDYTEDGGEHTHTGKVTGTTDATGGGEKHNNMMPYIGVNMWKRNK